MPFDNGHDLTGQLESIDSAHVAQDAHENVPIGHGDDVNVVDDDSSFASGPTTIVTRFVAVGDTPFAV